MAKRYQPLKEFGHSKKKPKLDVSVNKGRTGPSTSKAASDIHIPSTQKEPIKSVTDLWDDDEDDVILLATQVAESEIAASKAKNEVLPMEITDSEITFSEFAPTVNKHSTQRAPQDDLFSQMFDDDDEDIASLAAAIENNAKRQTALSEQRLKEQQTEAVFKKPAPPQKVSTKTSSFEDEPGSSTKRETMPSSQMAVNTGETRKPSVPPPRTYRYSATSDDEPGPSTKQVTSVTTGETRKQPAQSPRVYRYSSTSDDEPETSNKQITTPSSQTADTSAAARKQLASERQIKFLMEQLDSLKQKNAQLSKDLTEVKETVQTKTGEASMLRDELRHTKSKIDELKMEKMFQTETVNVECKNKIEELSKKVKDKESQLQLKSMECSVLKMRQADETRRHDTTVRNTTISNVDETPKKKPNISLDLSDLELSLPPVSVESVSIRLTEGVFERNEDEDSSRKWDTLIHRELDNMQRILAKVQLNPFDIACDLSKQVTESVRVVFLEFSLYVDNLDFGFHQTVLPQHEYNVLEDKSFRTAGCLHLCEEICSEERAIYMRRYIAVLGVICEQSSEVVHILLAEMHEEKPLFEIAINAISKLGFSLDVCAHFGILEAFALLLRSMLLHIKADKDGNSPYLELLFNLLKNIVFTRPSPWTLLELSYSVMDMCERFPIVFSLFCVNSKSDTFVIDRSKSVYRFSNETCLLQVYCGLLEAAFPLYLPLNEIIFELQTKICLNHVRFVYYCLTDPPDFIEKILSADEEDEESDDNIEQNTTQQSDGNKKTYESFRKAQPTKSKNIVLGDDQPTTSKNAIRREAQPTTSRNVIPEEEQPTTSKNVTATSSITDNTKANITDNTRTECTKTEQQCRCFEELCLSAVRMVYLSLRQWQRLEKLIELEQVGIISRVAVHLFHFLFCNNYLACLFREDEDTTKHFMYLICQWWVENKEELKFTDIQVELLNKIKCSHVIPKLFYEEEAKPENIIADLTEWCKITNDTFDPTIIDTEAAIKNLRLEEDLADPEIFFAGLKKPSIELETFEFE